MRNKLEKAYTNYCKNNGADEFEGEFYTDLITEESHSWRVYLPDIKRSLLLTYHIKSKRISAEEYQGDIWEVK